MLAIVFVLIAVVWRVALTNAHNFTPVLASLLFFGSRRLRRWLWAPVVALALSDVYLNLYHYGYPFTADLLVTWAWYAAMIWLGSLLRQKQNFVRVAGLALAGSISFFLISNFMVWLVWHVYPMTLSGLGQCYAAAIPFYRNQFAGDLIFTAAFFGIPALFRAHESTTEVAA